jgi:hypothetical protein
MAANLPITHLSAENDGLRDERQPLGFMASQIKFAGQWSGKQTMTAYD